VSRLAGVFLSSIGLKVLMAVSGLLMSLFLLGHVIGNLAILMSVEAYNEYANFLTGNKPFLYTAEAALIGIVLIHIFAAIALTRKNRSARPEAYAVRQNSGISRRSWASYNMIWTGGFIVFFLVVHLLNFKFGDYVETEIDGVVMRDMAHNVTTSFANPLTVGFYVVAMILILFHLLHGVRSTFATLGLESRAWARAIEVGTKTLVYAIMLGFCLIPLWIYFIGV